MLREFNLNESLPFSQGYAINAINKSIAGTLVAAGELTGGPENGTLLYAKFAHGGEVEWSESVWLDAGETLRCLYRRTSSEGWSERTEEGWSPAPWVSELFVDPVGTVFRWSTPAPNNDGSVPKPWRVSDASALRELLANRGYGDRVCYVEHDGKTRLHVGVRDNRDPVKYTEAVVELDMLLSSIGFTTALKVSEGKVLGIAVFDPNSATETATVSA